MARYIDADKLITHLQDEIKGCEPPFGSRANGKSIAYGTKLGLKSAISFADTFATEDVVTRSEVEELSREYESLAKTVNEGSELIRKLRNKIDEIKKDRYQVLPNGRIELIPRTDIDKIKTEVAREIFELIECAFSPVLVYNGYTIKEYLAELKKKYTEDKT